MTAAELGLGPATTPADRSPGRPGPASRPGRPAPTPGSASSEPAELVCRVCGRDFTSSRSKNPAYAKRAHERKVHGLSARDDADRTVVSIASPRRRERSAPADVSLRDPDGTKSDRRPSVDLDLDDDELRRRRVRKHTDEWTKWLKAQNPKLVDKTQAFCAIPDEWMDLVPPADLKRGKTGLLGVAPATGPDGRPTLVPLYRPTLREQLSLSDTDCGRIAKATAEFAETPAGLAIVGWLEANAAWIALLMAGWSAAMYGWTVMQIRMTTAELHKQIAEAVAAAQAQQAGGLPDAEDTADPAEQAAAAMAGAVA